MAQSHKAYLQECHDKFQLNISVEVNVIIEPKYYVRCFGRLIRVTEREAMMLCNVVIKK